MSDETEIPAEETEEDPDPGIMKRIAKFLRMKREDVLQKAADALPDEVMPHKALEKKKAQQREWTKPTY